MDARAESDDEGDEDIPIAERKLNDVEIVRTALSFLLGGKVCLYRLLQCCT